MSGSLRNQCMKRVPKGRIPRFFWGDLAKRDSHFLQTALKVTVQMTREKKAKNAKNKAVVD